MENFVESTNYVVVFGVTKLEMLTNFNLKAAIGD